MDLPPLRRAEPSERPRVLELRGVTNTNPQLVTTFGVALHMLLSAQRSTMAIRDVGPMFTVPPDRSDRTWTTGMLVTLEDGRRLLLSVGEYVEPA